MLFIVIILIIACVAYLVHADSLTNNMNNSKRRFSRALSERLRKQILKENIPALSDENLVIALKGFFSSYRAVFNSEHSAKEQICISDLIAGLNDLENFNVSTILLLANNIKLGNLEGINDTLCKCQEFCSEVLSKSQRIMEINELIVDRFAQALIEIAWDSRVEPNEAAIIKAKGISFNLYTVEVLCFSIFATVYGFSIWSAKNNYDQKQRVMEKFYALIAIQCQNSKKPDEFYALIGLRVRLYFEAQRIDMEKSAKEIFSMELHHSFLSLLVDASTEPPYELMNEVSIRFHVGIDVVSKVFDELLK
jgi:hypothetical protein